MRTNFENLRVYKLSEEIADAIWDMALGWQHFAKSTVGAQVVRSADSIGANIAEGVGRSSYADNRRFVRNERGWLNETKTWLRRADRRGLLTQKTIAKLKALLDELGPKLNNDLKSIGRVAPASPEDDIDN